MQIIYIHTTDINSHSTSANFVINNAYSLARHDVDVHLFIMNSSQESAAEIVKRKFKFSKPERLTIHDYRGEETEHFAFYRYTIRGLKTLVNSETVVITRTLSMLPHLFIAGRKVYNKLFFETHDFFYDLSIRDDIRRTKRLKYSFFEKLFFRHLDGLICLNKYQKALYEKYLPSQEITIFPTGLNREKTEDVPKEPYLIYAGSFQQAKGLNNVFSLAGMLNGNHKIWVAGARNENEKQQALQEVRRRNLSHKIEILPWMSKSELGIYLDKAKMGILPLEDNFFNKYLTVPLKLLDYFSHNLPVIATDLEIMREWVSDYETGLLINWDSPDAKINGLENILSSQERYSCLTTNVKRKAEDHTWDLRSRNQIAYLQTKL